ncbi:MAG: hypothetical protein IKH56_02345 [Oscillospiraceae bacterium]|nr:hypothetical protein [Oscillospiraceae bacterium]
MISLDEYRAILSELMDELPEEFFRELTGGVIASEALVIPDYARGDDLFTMGQYQVYSGIRQIVMYKGSFDRVYPQADTETARGILRDVLRHEFRHHLEYLGGIHDAGSLEAEDARAKQAYLSQQTE